MKIFDADATRDIGGRLVAQLVARGQEIVGTRHSAAKTGSLRALGAEPVIVDARDADSAPAAVTKAEPEVILHQLTALSRPADVKCVKRMTAATNRLRPEGTDRPVAAVCSIGVHGSVVQSTRYGPNAPSAPVTDESGRGSSRTRPRTARRQWPRRSTWRTGDSASAGTGNRAALRRLLRPADRHELRV
ncbi:hypothetical protein [Streptomyces sp. NPDC002550]